MSDATQEFADGVAFWGSKLAWPADFHNADYEKWASENPHGNFTPSWWGPFLRRLHSWKATRPFGSAELTPRFMERAEVLGEVWREACVPALDEDISTVSWERIASFPIEVGKIKPTKRPSPVFMSKFCHFLLPKVFPVVDDEGLGNRWPTYERYFKFVQEVWKTTDVVDQSRLEAELSRLIELAGQRPSSYFPMKNKIVELRLIGRQHPHIVS